jgi:hypothetical protein
VCRKSAKYTSRLSGFFLLQIHDFCYPPNKGNLKKLKA